MERSKAVFPQLILRFFSSYGGYPTHVEYIPLWRGDALVLSRPPNVVFSFRPTLPPGYVFISSLLCTFSLALLFCLSLIGRCNLLSLDVHLGSVIRLQQETGLPHVFAQCIFFLFRTRRFSLLSSPPDVSCPASYFATLDRRCSVLPLYFSLFF